jgi:hypothetical protein
VSEREESQFGEVVRDTTGLQGGDRNKIGGFERSQAVPVSSSLEREEQVGGGSERHYSFGEG